jgi:hypothetical protein
MIRIRSYESSSTSSAPMLGASRTTASSNADCIAPSPSSRESEQPELRPKLDDDTMSTRKARVGTKRDLYIYIYNENETTHPKYPVTLFT